MDRIETLLGILAEECAEVAQRASKAQRFGMSQRQADQPLTNAERITFELNDLYAVVNAIRDEPGSGTGFGMRLPSLMMAKRAKIEKYLAPDRDLAALDRESLEKDS